MKGDLLAMKSLIVRKHGFASTLIFVFTAFLVSSVNAENFSFDVAFDIASPQDINSKFSISGIVSGAIKAGIAISLSGASMASTTSAADGTYSFANLADGNYTVTPTLAGYKFNPGNIPVTVAGGNQTGKDFVATATAVTYSISGTVSGEIQAGVAISLSGASMASTTTAADGTYSFANLANGTYTVTPTFADYTFDPTYIAVTIANGNQTGKNFTAFFGEHFNVTIGSTFTIDLDLEFDKKPTVYAMLGGKKKAVKVITKSADFDGQSLECQWTASGQRCERSQNGNDILPSERSFSKCTAGDYEIWAKGEADGEKVESREGSVTVMEPSITSVSPMPIPSFGEMTVTGDYIGSKPKAWIIYDCADKSGVKKICKIIKGAPPEDLGGQIKISVPKLKSGAEERVLHISSGIGEDSISLETYTISGTLTGAVQAGVAISLSGASMASTTTAADGTYSFANIADGNYTVTPTLAGYEFNPADIAVTIAGANQTGINFTAIANTPPVAADQSVTVSKNSAKSITLVATDADGDTLTYSVVADPSHGTLSGTAPNLTYTPATDYTGSDSFTFKANDGKADSNTATVSITVSGFVDGAYIVVDLSSGVLTELSTVPSDLLSNTAYKSSSIVLRKIPAGTFAMGSPTDELGRDEDETQHPVTLTKDFYIGVFEVTQAQYQAVMGSNPSEYKGDYRPVETVSWDDVRGGTWPSGDPGSGTFMDKMRTLSAGHAFDLPTEAQWEYACRAGTTTALNSGKNLTNENDCPNMDVVGRYFYNQSDGMGAYAEHTTVGNYQVNDWGLYDMHGNAREWCLDWYADYGGTVTDPVGALSGSRRVHRGGSWGSFACGCRSAFRYIDIPSYSSRYIGFRFVLPAGQ